jgi:hypothetical protein
LVDFHMLFRSTRGGLRWLVKAEQRYDGYVDNVPRWKISPFDPRSAKELATGGMFGGDRMSSRHHGYGRHYAKYLKPFLSTSRDLVVVEVGVLKGTGLAIWCELFPAARVIGLDIDLGHIESNMPTLLRQGAFTSNKPELYEFDQLIDQRDVLNDILGTDRVDILIDDGLHSIQSITTSVRSFEPYLSENFVAFIEDNATAAASIKRQFPRFTVKAFGELSVVTP